MRVRLHAEAEEELFAGAAWYDGQRPGLADDLLGELAAVLTALADAPETSSPWPDAPRREPVIRRALLSVFPYAIAYQCFDDELVVLAVAHTSRRPLYWAHRGP